MTRMTAVGVIVIGLIIVKMMENTSASNPSNSGGMGRQKFSESFDNSKDFTKLGGY